MNNYLENEIKNLEDELTALKTTLVKSAAAIPLAQKSVSFSSKLKYVEGFTPFAIKRYRLKFKNDEPAITNVTLDWYCNSPFDTHNVAYRYADALLLETLIILQLYGDAKDMETIRNGGEVTMSTNMTVTSTGEFDIVEED